MQVPFFRNLKEKTIVVGGDHHARGVADIIYAHLLASGLKAERAPYDDARYDYIEQSKLVAGKVSRAPDLYCGIVGCRNGFGVTTVCNKYRNVFAARCDTPEEAANARIVNYSNVLTFGSSFVDEDTIKRIVNTWLETEFELNEKNTDRLKRLFAIET